MQHFIPNETNTVYACLPLGKYRQELLLWSAAGIGTGFVAGSAFWLMVARIWGVL